MSQYKRITQVLFSPVLLLTLFFLTSPVFAGTVNLPQTGQKKCYDTSGAVIPCTGTGQDGEIQAGVEWPSPRFTVSGEVVTDNLTGLMWTKNGNLPSGPMSWDQALNYANNLTLAGYTDWRLPNVNELESLVNGAESNTATWLNTQGFTNVQTSFYWSSTTILAFTEGAWVVVMDTGQVQDAVKSDDGYVWPVRSGQCGSFDNSVICLPKTGQTKCYNASGAEISCSGTGQDGELQAGVAWPSPRFTDNGNTVTDNLTGLMWTKNANLPGSYKTWQQALDYEKGMNAGTYEKFGDWRLPNRKELHSLTDYSQWYPEYPALPTGHPFTNVQADYWSSTTYAYKYTDSAWVVDMGVGSVRGYYKSGTYVYVWPVRSGQTGPLDYWTISGTVTGDVIAGVTMTLSGTDSGSTTTDSSGNYSFSGLSNGTYTVTPSMSGYSFTPPSRTVNISGANVTGVDFVASSSSCAAEALIDSQNAPKKNDTQSTLSILRHFRDQVLDQTDEGRELATLYYQHSSEIIRIMAENPVLAGKTLLLLLKNVPALDAAAKNGNEMTIGKKVFTQAMQLLNDYESHASPELSDALNKVKAFVKTRSKELNAGIVRIDFNE